MSSLAMHFFMLGGTETHEGRGGLQVLRAYFQSDSIKAQRSPRGQVALQIPYGL